ncbi:hypothetical protein NQ318_014471 [Aromia moschata]|uniref:Triacylglycerol lipase n=1 Tax=Aromia moschata TaxID=1265417 RepID=A0AAV8YNY7_9CUCU|nr:hypothetical protein NQ318_014471 [Aromia moschata]
MIRQYDYGWVQNIIKYLKMVPPDYDLSRVLLPVALYYGKNDLLVGTPDVDRLAEKLPNVVKKHLVDNDKFNHGDFLIAKDVVPLLYSHIVDVVNEYSRFDPSPPITSTFQPSSNRDSSSSQTWFSISTQPATPSSSSKFSNINCWFYSVILLVKLLL